MIKNKNSPVAKSQFPGDRIIELVLVFSTLVLNILYKFVEWYVIFINFALLVVGFFILYYLNNKTKIKSINNEIDLLKDVTQDIKELSSYPALLEHVCGSKRLMMIEGSVGENEHNDQQIYVQSSKFELESNDDFSHMLINNLRKGVHYNYLIPFYNNRLDYQQFYEMVIGWWNDYSKHIVDKECCSILMANKNEHWQKQYVDNLETAASYWDKGTSKAKRDKLIDELYELFKRRLSVYTADQSIFYIVTAIYQVGPNMWKAIIKLPTEYGKDSNDDYYSFVVFGDTYSNSNNAFITQFRHNFKEENLFNMEDLYKKLDDRVVELKREKYKQKPKS